MTQLEALKLEIERQDGEFQLRFDELSRVDPSLEFALPQEALEGISGAVAPAPTQHVPWNQRV
jgi:hypothetical protein